jgi:DNA repair protein RecO (recombination protein O)
LTPRPIDFWLGLTSGLDCAKLGWSAAGMPLIETEAIVLRTYRLAEADKIVSLFTRQMGRVRGVASGAQRPKSRYGGTLESLGYVRLWLYERENRDLARLNSVEIIESFFDLQKDYSSHLAGQYLVEVTERLLPEREASERTFRLLLAVLRILKRSREVERPLAYFNYWILRLGGFLPDLTHCSACGRAFGNEMVHYSAALPGLFGRECRHEIAAPSGGTVSANSLNEIQGACAAALDKWMLTEYKASELSEVRQLLESMVEAQAERKLVTRSMLAEVSR